MAMITAYLDESGWEPQSPTCIFGGFLGYADNWVRFSEAWVSFADEEPKTPDFHMKVAFRLRGSGTYWGDGTEAELIDRRDRKLIGFAKIIRQHALLRVYSGMDWGSYKKHLRDRLPKEYDSPLFFGFVRTIGELANWHRQFKIPDPIELIFDRQNRMEGHATAWFNHLAENIDPYVARAFSGPPAFRCSSKVLPLKAADILVWQMRRNVAEKAAHPEGRAERRAELDYLLGIPTLDASVTTPHLAAIAKTLSGEAVPVPLLPKDEEQSS